MTTAKTSFRNPAGDGIIAVDGLEVNGVLLTQAMLDNIRYQTASYSEVNALCDMDSRVELVAATPYALGSVNDRNVIVLNRAAGLAITLPAATGSGVQFDIVVGVTFTGACTIKCVGNDIMKGFAILGLDGGDTCSFFATAADTDTITFAADNTTGGIAGARITLKDILADTWAVEIFSDAAGAEATPFSATVS